MLARTTLWGVLLAWANATASGQTIPPEPPMVPSPGWHKVADRIDVVVDPRFNNSAQPGVGNADPRSSRAGPAGFNGVIRASATTPVAAPAPGPAQPGAAAAAPRQPLAHFTEGITALPNTQGQIWREYDISPYTKRVTTTRKPEQAIVDWILRETGYEVWHGEPLGILSATASTLRVYHTPQVQNVVGEIIDRFVASEAESKSFALRVATLDQPNWQTRVHHLLRPVNTHTPGVQAWLLLREDAAMLLSDLKRRNDYREYSAPQLLVNNGQSAVVNSQRSRPYVRNVVLRKDAWPGFETDTAQVDEGFSLEFSPLASIDGRLIDATIKCDVDQVEKMIPVTIDASTAAAPRQRTQLEVPQLLHNRFHERFRWPVDQVLLVSLGMVAIPPPPGGASIMSSVPLIGTTAGRANLLVFVEPRLDPTPTQRRLTQVPSPSAAAAPQR